MSKYIELTRNLASGQFEGQVKDIKEDITASKDDDLTAYRYAQAALARHYGVVGEHGTAQGDAAKCVDFQYGNWFKEGWYSDEDKKIYEKTRKARQKKTGE